MGQRRVDSQAVTAVISVCALLLLQGCTGGVSSRDVAGYDGALARGDYKGAAELAVAAGQIGPDGTSKNLVWSLNAGAAMVQTGDGKRTIPVLDGAERMMQSRDLTSIDTSGQYRAKTYDGVMVNTYKAIAAMQAGDSQTARVELRRAEDRQRRAEEEFQKEATAVQAKATQDKVDTGSGIRSLQGNVEYQRAMREMSNYGGYAPFVNPFSTYLLGLYLLNSPASEPDQARAAFGRVRGIVGPSSLLNSDYALAERGRKPSPKTWVIFENGQGSTLTEYSLQIPIPIVTRGRVDASLVRLALPQLRENGPATRGLLVGDVGAPTTSVGNFDYVQRSEFSRRYPTIVAAAIAEVAVKALAQNLAANVDKSGIASLITIVASQVSNADTRSWTALPKEFQAARIETPKNGQVRLRTAEGADLGTATVPIDASSIVYVKALRPGSPPAIQVLRF